MSQASKDYVRLLLPRLLGYPIWKPTPDANLPNEYCNKGISVGDVGILSPNGEFDFLFSICVPSDHAINSRGTPDNFEDVRSQINIEKQEGFHRPDTVIASTSMKIKNESANLFLHASTHVPVGVEGRFHFTCSTSEGAVLLLPQGGSQENLLDLRIFFEQAVKHGLQWYEYTNLTRNRMAQNGSLYLVTGCDKTSSWGIASFSNTSGEDEVSLKFEACQVATVGASYAYKWETTSPATVRVGPPSCDYLACQRTQEPANTLGKAISRLLSILMLLLDTILTSIGLSFRQTCENQCVFVRGYRISVRSWRSKISKKSVVSVDGTNSKDASHSTKDKDIPFFDRGNSSWFRGIRDGAVFGRRRHVSHEPVENQEIDSDRDEESSGEDIVIEAVPAAPNLYPPFAAINDYLLDTNPEAQVAVTHDDDLLPLFLEDGVIPNDNGILSRFRDRYSATMRHGGVTLRCLRPKSFDQRFSIEKVLVKEMPERNSSWFIAIHGKLRYVRVAVCMIILEAWYFELFPPQRTFLLQLKLMICIMYIMSSHDRKFLLILTMAATAPIGTDVEVALILLIASDLVEHVISFKGLLWLRLQHFIGTWRCSDNSAQHRTKGWPKLRLHHFIGAWRRSDNSAQHWTKGWPKLRLQHFIGAWRRSDNSAQHRTRDFPMLHGFFETNFSAQNKGPYLNSESAKKHAVVTPVSDLMASVPDNPLPAASITQKSMQVAKANTKKDVRELFEFEQLGQEYQAISRTFEEMGGGLD